MVFNIRISSQKTDFTHLQKTITITKIQLRILEFYP